MAAVVLIAIGSRGDVQPMAVLGGALQAVGVQTRVVALKDYAGLIHDLGAEPVVIPARLSDAIDLTKRRGARVILRHETAQGLLLHHWMGEISPLVLAAVEGAVGAGDTVLSGVLSRDLAVALAEDRGCRAATLLFTGQLPTLQRSSNYFASWFRSWDAYNRWGSATNWTIVSSIGLPLSTPFRRIHGLRIRRPREATRAADQFPTILAVNPTLVPPAPDWPANAHQTGFLAMPRTPGLPPLDLVEFLAEGPPPVYVGFGSMSGTPGFNDAGLLIDAARLAGCRIVTPAGVGLRPGRADDRVLAIPATPHGWLFPRMAGIVHHGGAGTTQDGLAAGVPSVATPFGIDQPYHADRLYALGVGPAPIRILRLTPPILAGLIHELTSGRYDQRAAEVGRQSRSVDGVAETIRVLSELGLLPAPTRA